MRILEYINFWLIFGLTAQFVYFLRVVVQWLYSEKKKKSIIPISYWYLSLLGSVMITIYALYKQDIVFVLGGFLSTFIYIRNLILFKKYNREEIEK